MFDVLIDMLKHLIVIAAILFAIDLCYIVIVGFIKQIYADIEFKKAIKKAKEIIINNKSEE